MVSNWTNDKRDTSNSPNGTTEFALTNWTERTSFDCNTATLGETSDTLGTLIKQLIEKGIITGTVSA